jgi:predicted RND superfamily exporter protein
MTTMMRDIDYAAQAVRTSIQQKFGRRHDLQELKVDAAESTIRVALDDQKTEGTRDDLMAAIRKAESLDDFWSGV